MTEPAWVNDRFNKFDMDHFNIIGYLPDGMLLRGSRSRPSKATLEQAFTEIAAAQENWSDLNTSTVDGLNKLVWPCPPLIFSKP